MVDLLEVVDLREVVDRLEEELLLLLWLRSETSHSSAAESLEARLLLDGFSVMVSSMGISSNCRDDELERDMERVLERRVLLVRGVSGSPLLWLLPFSSIPGLAGTGWSSLELKLREEEERPLRWRPLVVGGGFLGDSPRKEDKDRMELSMSNSCMEDDLPIFILLVRGVTGSSLSPLNRDRETPPSETDMRPDLEVDLRRLDLLALDPSSDWLLMRLADAWGSRGGLDSSRRPIWGSRGGGASSPRRLRREVREVLDLVDRFDLTEPPPSSADVDLLRLFELDLMEPPSSPTAAAAAALELVRREDLDLMEPPSSRSDRRRRRSASGSRGALSSSPRLRLPLSETDRRLLVDLVLRRDLPDFWLPSSKFKLLWLVLIVLLKRRREDSCSAEGSRVWLRRMGALAVALALGCCCCF